MTVALRLVTSTDLLSSLPAQKFPLQYDEAIVLNDDGYNFHVLSNMTITAFRLFLLTFNYITNRFI